MSGTRKGRPVHAPTPHCAGNHLADAPCSVPPMQPGFLDTLRPQSPPGSPPATVRPGQAAYEERAERMRLAAERDEARSELRRLLAAVDQHGTPKLRDGHVVASVRRVLAIRAGSLAVPDGGQEAADGQPEYSQEAFYAWLDGEADADSDSLPDMEGAYAAGFNAALPRVLAEAARYKAERDEARKGLAGVQHGAGARVRDAVASATDGLTAALATCRQNNAAIAVQLDQYRDERDEARKVIEEMLDWFWEPDTDDGDGSEATYPKVDEWRQRAGLGEP